MKRLLAGLGLLLLALVVYLLSWPVPIDPAAWDAPPNPGYIGPFESNTRLAEVEKLPIGNFHGPEDIAVDADGRIFAATHEGWIVTLDPDGGNAVGWAETGGRPLGIDFAPNGDLIVADAFKGLLAIGPDGTVRVLADEADGVPIRYADDVDCAEDGRIFFSDASTRFGARESGGTMQAGLLDLMEHRPNGRLLVFDPVTETTTTLLAGISFANGVAVSPDQSFVLLNETGMYRVLKYWLTGPEAGQAEVVIDELPGFPDNISTGREGRFWLALVSPRNRLLDAMSDKPFLRKMVQRLPSALRPAAQPYGHVLAIGADGTVLVNLQDPDGGYPINTTAVETEDYLYIGSLVAPEIARLPMASLRTDG